MNAAKSEFNDQLLSPHRPQRLWSCTPGVPLSTEGGGGNSSLSFFIFVSKQLSNDATAPTLTWSITWSCLDKKLIKDAAAAPTCSHRTHIGQESTPPTFCLRPTFLEKQGERNHCPPRPRHISNFITATKPPVLLVLTFVIKNQHKSKRKLNGKNDGLRMNAFYYFGTNFISFIWQRRQTATSGINVIRIHRP